MVGEADVQNPSPWKAIGGFSGWREYERFQEWMNSQILANNAKETAVKKGSEFSFGSFDERWFIHVESNEVWRLVKPEPPFSGVFQKV